MSISSSNCDLIPDRLTLGSGGHRIETRTCVLMTGHALGPAVEKTPKILTVSDLDLQFVMSSMRIASTPGHQRAMTKKIVDKSGAITARLAMTIKMGGMTVTSMMTAIGTTKIRGAIERAALRLTRSIAATETRRSTDLRAHTVNGAASIAGATALDRTHRLPKTSTMTRSRARVARVRATRTNIASGIGLVKGTAIAIGETAKTVIMMTRSTVRAKKTRRSGAVVTVMRKTIVSMMTTSTVPRGAAGKIATAIVTEIMRGNLHQQPPRVQLRLPSTHPLVLRQTTSPSAVPASRKHPRTCLRRSRRPALAAFNLRKAHLLIATAIVEREASALRHRRPRHRHHRTTTLQSERKTHESATV